jgi:hypothetical protein
MAHAIIEKFVVVGWWKLSPPFMETEVPTSCCLQYDIAT